MNVTNIRVGVGLVAVAVLVAFLTAVGLNTGANLHGSVGQPAVVRAVGVPPPYPGPVDPQAEAVQAVREDFAKELGVAVEQVTLISVAARDWPSSALGCPKPGMSYLQVVTPGFEIHLAAGDLTAEYHTNQKTGDQLYWVHCDQLN